MFNILDNQNFVFVPVPVDASGNSLPNNTYTSASLVSADPTIITVIGQDAGFSADWDCKCAGKDGTVVLTMNGVNANGQAFSTDFTFSVTAPASNPAVGFTATLINVKNN